MPLSGMHGDITIQDNYYSATLTLVSILCREPFSNLFETQNIEFERLVYSYPGIPILNKAQYVKDILAYYEAKEVKRFIEHIVDFEKYLHALGKREHFSHQFETLLLGLHLLELILNKTPNPEVTFGFSSEKTIYTTWVLSSLGHDFGYPAETSVQLFSELSRLYKNFYLDSVSTSLDSTSIAVSSSKRHNRLIRYRPSTETGHVRRYFDIRHFVRTAIEQSVNQGSMSNDILEELVDSNDHGYISALIACRKGIEKYYESNRSGDNSLETFIKTDKIKMLNFATGAIGIHNHNTFYNLISFENNPYAYLLILLDNVQDWDRKIFPDTQHPDYTLCGFDVQPESITVKVLIGHRDWTTAMIQSTIAFISDKKNLLENIIIPPNPKKGITLSIKYETNIPERIKDSTITINI